MKVQVVLSFTNGYIAHPYWPEQERLINIQKESGVNRVRSAEKRVRALDAYLQSHHMTRADYDRLEGLAHRPFYRWADVELDRRKGQEPQEIVIPAHQMYGCLAQAASLAPASVRLSSVEQLRSVLTVSDWATAKLKEDGIWERFVVVKAGAGGKLSNQRALRSNPYIHQFKATGFLMFPDPDKAQRVRDFLGFAGREVGVGASRKLGWGRFEIAEWR